MEKIRRILSTIWFVLETVVIFITVIAWIGLVVFVAIGPNRFFVFIFSWIGKYQPVTVVGIFLIWIALLVIIFIREGIKSGRDEDLKKWISEEGEI